MLNLQFVLAPHSTDMYAIKSVLRGSWIHERCKLFSVQSVRFELSGPAEGYVALALSWDTMMVSHSFTWTHPTASDMDLIRKHLSDSVFLKLNEHLKLKATEDWGLLIHHWYNQDFCSPSENVDKMPINLIPFHFLCFILYDIANHQWPNVTCLPLTACLHEQGNDDVYLCIKDGDSVSVSAAFVSGRTYPEEQSQVRLIFCRIIDPTNILHSFHV